METNTKPDAFTQALAAIAKDRKANGGISATDKPDENGLVYFTTTFTVDPAKYVSATYRPSPSPIKQNAGKIAQDEMPKVVMDAGVRKAPTRETCQTSFAQCRAKNPLFCRFHGPKLLEEDIRKTIRVVAGNGSKVSVTKDKASSDRFTFRLTVGCPPHMKDKVEKVLNTFLKNNPGIKQKGNWQNLDERTKTSEIEMDTLRAEAPPAPDDAKGQRSVMTAKAARSTGRQMGVVGETPTKIERAARGEEPPPPETASEAEKTEPPMEESPLPQPPQEQEEQVEEQAEQTETTPPEAEQTPSPEEAQEEQAAETPAAPSVSDIQQIARNLGLEGMETAEHIRRTSAEADNAENIAKELDERIQEYSNDETSNPIVRGAAIMAMEAAQTTAEDRREDATDSVESLDRQRDASFRDIEQRAKGEAAAAVEQSMTDLASVVFPPDSEVETVTGAVEALIADLHEFALDKGQEIADSQSEVIDASAEAIKEHSDELDRLMEQMRNGMNSTGADFHAEELDFSANGIKRAANALISEFLALKGKIDEAKENISLEAELAETRAQMEADLEQRRAVGVRADHSAAALSNEANGDIPNEAPAPSSAREADDRKIAEIYESWVEEPIPDWVHNLSDEETAEYRDLLVKASTNTEDTSEPIENLTAFENRHQPKSEEEEEAPAAEPEPPPPPPPTESEAEIQMRRQEVLTASRRLGLDAFKPAEDLRRMLNTISRMANGNPRLEQRVRDIELILADREAKKNQAPREGGSYVGDSLTESEYLKVQFASMLEG